MQKEMVAECTREMEIRKRQWKPKGKWDEERILRKGLLVGQSVEKRIAKRQGQIQEQEHSKTRRKSRYNIFYERIQVSWLPQNRRKRWKDEEIQMIAIQPRNHKKGI